MTSFPVHFLVSSNQANLMAINAIAQGFLNAVERVAVLNIETSRAATEYAANGLRLLHGGEWQGRLSPQGGGLQSPTVATMAYFRQVQDIASAVQADVTKVISERPELAIEAKVAAPIGKARKAG